MEDNIVMEQENQQEYNNMETPDYPVEVTYLPPQNDDSKDSDSIGGAEIAVGGFAIAGVAAVGYGIYRGIKALINKIKGSDEDEEEEEEEKPRKKKVKKVSKKKVKKAPAKKKPEPEEEEDDDDYEVEESDEDTED